MTEQNKMSNDDQGWRRPQAKAQERFQSGWSPPFGPQKGEGPARQRAAATKERGIYLRTKSPWPGENMLQIYGGHESILVM